MSKLFDVCSNSTLEEMEQQDEVKVAWGTGIAGHVAESGEPVNIPDAYQVSTANDGHVDVASSQGALVVAVVAEVLFIMSFAA